MSDRRDAELDQEIFVNLMQCTPKGQYSASVVDWVVQFCFLDLQLTAPPQVMTSPLVDL
jgi:hypothetical protein